MVQDVGRRKKNQWVYGIFCIKLTIKLQVKKRTWERQRHGATPFSHHPFVFFASFPPPLLYAVGNALPIGGFKHAWICLSNRWGRPSRSLRGPWQWTQTGSATYIQTHPDKSSKLEESRRRGNARDAKKSPNERTHSQGGAYLHYARTALFSPPRIILFLKIWGWINTQHYISFRYTM